MGHITSRQVRLTPVSLFLDWGVQRNHPGALPLGFRPAPSIPVAQKPAERERVEQLTTESTSVSAMFNRPGLARCSSHEGGPLLACRGSERTRMPRTHHPCTKSGYGCGVAWKTGLPVFIRCSPVQHQASPAALGSRFLRLLGWV